MVGKGIYLYIDNLPEVRMAGCESLVLDVRGPTMTDTRRLVVPIDAFKDGRLALARAPHATILKGD